MAICLHLYLCSVQHGIVLSYGITLLTLSGLRSLMRDTRFVVLAAGGAHAQYKGVLCRAIGKFSKDDNTVAAKEEKEEAEHAQGIAKHDVFGMSIKAKDVDDEGDVRAVDTNLQVICGSVMQRAA